MAGLLSQEAGADKIGMIVAQEYPALTKMIIPGFLAGAQAVNPNFELDQRLLGNWYDANKAAELTKSMVDGGAFVIGAICGGASQGVLDAAGEAGAKVMMWDSNEYGRAPGIVAGSGALAQERLVFEEVTKAIDGLLEFGTARVVSLADGYVEFVTDDVNYKNTVSLPLQEAQDAVISSIKNGVLRLEVPEL